MYLLLAFEHLILEWNIPSLIPFPIINSMSISINSCNYSLIFFKATYRGNPGAERNFAGSNT